MSRPHTVPHAPSDSNDRAVLAERALALALPLKNGQDDTTVPLLLITVADRQLAIDLDHVVEVRPPGPVAHVPDSRRVLQGVVAGRGIPLAVACLGALLGLNTGTDIDEQWIIVLDHPTAPVGLLADAAADVVTVQQQDLSGGSPVAGPFRAVLPDGCAVLDVPALLRDPRLSMSPSDQNEEPTWHEA